MRIKLLNAIDLTEMPSPYVRQHDAGAVLDLPESIATLLVTAGDAVLDEPQRTAVVEPKAAPAPHRGSR